MLEPVIAHVGCYEFVKSTLKECVGYVPRITVQPRSLESEQNLGADEMRLYGPASAGRISPLSSAC